MKWTKNETPYSEYFLPNLGVEKCEQGEYFLQNFITMKISYQNKKLKTLVVSSQEF